MKVIVTYQLRTDQGYLIQQWDALEDNHNVVTPFKDDAWGRDDKWNGLWYVRGLPIVIKKWLQLERNGKRLWRRKVTHALEG